MNADETPSAGTGGSAVLAALIFAMCAAMTISFYLAYTSQEILATRRTQDLQKAQLAAESALEYGMIKLKQIVVKNQLMVFDTNAVQAQLNAIPPPPDYPPFTFNRPGSTNSAFRIRVTSPVADDQIITNGNVAYGCQGDYQEYIITAGAYNPATGVGAVYRLRTMAKGIQLIRYAIFYDADMEIIPGANMNVTGPVHGNANLFLYSTATLNFSDRVTTHRNLYNYRLDDPTVQTGNVYIAANDGGPMNKIWLDSRSPQWMVYAETNWNHRVLTAAHGMPDLTPPLAPSETNAHVLIERPLDPTNALYDAITETNKLSRRAAIYIGVTSNGVLYATNQLTQTSLTALFTNAKVKVTNSLYVKDSANDDRYVVTNNGCFVVNTQFCDLRESGMSAVSNVTPVDLYIDKMMNILSNVPGTSRVVYVTRDDPDGTNRITPVVRIRNANRLPDGGLTVASDLPIYIEGNFNVGITNTALVAGDAVTFLSKNWQDSRSTAAIASRVASNTTYNTVILTAHIPTHQTNYVWNGTNLVPVYTNGYSGGVENVLRFLENWTGKTVSYRGSIIDLWTSSLADGPWIYGNYYTAPTRDWGYDQQYRTNSPPGVIRVFGLETIDWQQSTWAAVSNDWR